MTASEDEAATEFLRKNFRHFQEWSHWYDKAFSLKKQATILYRAAMPDLRKFEKARDKATHGLLKGDQVVPVEYAQPDLLPAFSLFGSSLENALKGVVVSNNPSLISESKLSSKLKTHNLIELAGAAGVPLSARETRVLEWLTEVVVWKARYSVPTGTKFAVHFFHRLDYPTLEGTRVCKKAIQDVFKKATKAMPRRGHKVKFGALVRVDA